PVEVKVRCIKLDREYLIGTVRDITERKQAEKILSENEKRFSTLFQASPIAMSVTTANEGCYLDVNEEFLKLVERPREEVIGHTSLELGIWARPEERAKHMAKLKEQ